MHVNWFYVFGVPFAVVLLFLPLLFGAIERAIDRRRQKESRRVLRIGYLPCHVKRATCRKCGTACVPTRSVVRLVDDQELKYTEFICPKCLPPPRKGK